MNIGPENNGGKRVGGSQGDPGLEAELRQALAPTEAPPGFADRLMARALAGDAPPSRKEFGPRPALRPLPVPDSPRWRRWAAGGAIAAALAAGVLEGGAALRRVHEQRQRVAAATRQFQTTERITTLALAQTREQLQRAGVPLNLD